MRNKITLIMNISIQRGDILDLPCDLLVVNLFKGVKDQGGANGAVDLALNGDLSKLIRRDRFEGNLGERLTFPTFGRMNARKVCVLGLGDRKKFTADAVRKIGGWIVKASKEAKSKHVVTILHGAGVAGLDAQTAAQALGEGLRLGAYEFREHLGTGSRSKKRFDIAEVTIVEAEREKIRPAARGLERARVIADGTVAARDLVNMSPRHMNPMELAAAARALAVRGSGVSCRVLNRESMERMGMGAALAVAEGSAHPPSCVHLTYKPSRWRGKPKKKAKQIIAVVGKGVTFDSGGLSLKSADNMANMKIDMGGAAAVIGLFRVLRELRPPVEVHGIFIAVENMPSGRSYRPGDVVTAMNGMTIEIRDTDAEGRVTLADALSYAVKRVKPDVLIDVATLTGAVIVALGDDYAGLLSNNRTLARAMVKAAREAGELLWEFPLAPQYDEAMKSNVADMNNTGGRPAGAIKAGLFLKRFVGDTPWAHLDIAGPVFCEKETRPDVPQGGTGAGVRTLVAYLESLR
jgi:leucyl aminopeptidase